MKVYIEWYQIKDKISESERSLVFRALQKNNQTPVVIKTLNEEYPSPFEINRFRREYQW